MGISPRITYMGALLTKPPLNTRGMGPQLLELAGDEDAFVDFDASFESVAHVGLDDDSHVVTGRLHHLLHAHAHEAHAVVERTAVLVATVVGIGREELADEVAVSGVNLSTASNPASRALLTASPKARAIASISSLCMPRTKVGE